MITFSKTINKPGFLFGKLPNYFKANDNHIPNTVVGYENDGLLERYLDIFGLELDNQFTPYIDSLHLLYDAIGLNNIPGNNTDRFLIHIADTLGNPPDIGTNDQYKTLLRYLIHILKNKGNRASLDMYLALFGYQVSEIVIDPYDSLVYDNLPTPAKYDSGRLYDTNVIWYFNMVLTIEDLNGTNTGAPTTQWLIDLRDALNNFIMPITVEISTVNYV